MSEKKSKPFFSIIIPLYNKKRHIKRAIDSVLKQTVKDFELVVINDGSTDGSEKVVQQYTDSRILLIEQKNQGVSVARNRGIVDSRGNYICFLDADDEWLCDYLETIQKLIVTYPSAKAYGTSFYYITSNGIKKTRSYSSLSNQLWEGVLPNYFKVAYSNGSPLRTSVTCVKKNIFNDIEMFREGVKIGEDVDLWVRIALEYNIAFTTVCKAIYYENSDNRSNNISSAPKIEPIFVTLLQKKLDNNDVPEYLINDVKKFIATFLINFSKLNMEVGDYKQAKKFLFDKRCNKFLKLKIKYIVVYNIKYFIHLIKNCDIIRKNT